MDNRSILIIYTGGTIGMVQKDGHGALAPVRFDQIVEEVPELKRLGCHLDSITFNPPLDSSDMSPKTWGRLAKMIQRNYRKYDGFVILHGTDTMAYTASALSYMLENLDKAVVMTGSQLPIGVLRTDGKENLITAIEIAAAQENGTTIVPEVCIYFDNKLYRGNRVVKRHADHFSAFDSVNYPILAKAGVDIRFFHENIYHPVKKGILKVSSNFDDRVVVLKIFPGMNQEIFEQIINIPSIRGVVLETFGSGNIPTLSWLVRVIKKALRRNVICVNVTQCQGGTVKMGQYQTSRELKKIGVVSGKDMTTEAAVTKLMFLLGQGLNHEDVKMHLRKNLSGEISE
ncbi:asparaginase [Sunxiuqinia elliptica]|uniref:asparaginase n=1 Tax=Sunxiuqinia elliptica TaxID=655355 RepID=A0A1I2JWK2_9BACT|nr:asparaginase [Sunxiuqinia elliptica]SFF57191.1 L-asparaginase [Sunxiuqinia elliptica]